MPVIEVEDLRKVFTVSRRREGAGGLLARWSRETVAVRAVEGISFTVGAGERGG